jgi:hypothetical protein
MELGTYVLFYRIITLEIWFNISALKELHGADVFFWKQMAAQLVKKMPTFNGARNFITLLHRSRSKAMCNVCYM